LAAPPLASTGRGERRLEILAVHSPPLPPFSAPTTASAYPQPMAMPQPGDPYANAFVAEYMGCWRVIHDRQGQATHCMETPTWTGQWFAPSGKRWWRVWACERHLEGLTGLKEFGGPKASEEITRPGTI
jgi:hypothetical protein